MNLLESSSDVGASQSLSKAEGRKPEDKCNDVPTPVDATQISSAMKKLEKHGRPEDLDLEDAREISNQGRKNTTTADLSYKVAVDANVAPVTPSQPETPATLPSQPSAPTSTHKTQPKTIRLSGTSKTELPSPGIGPSQGSGQAPRRPSITSLNRPETPASERISDTLSYTSASMSRANSPPPSKIGSAPTRRVTKSQQKKERQDRARKAEEGAVKKEEPAPREEETVVQAPIVGRKKKTKKPKEKTGATADSTPAVTRPTSPELPELSVKEEMPPPPLAEPLKSTKENKKQIKLPPIAPVEPEPSQSIPATPAAAEPSQGTPAQSTAAEIFAHLHASGELPQNAIETLFKPITGASHRLDHNLDSELILSGHPSALNPNQIAQLDNNEPVVILLDNNNALIVFPNRRCLKGLTPKQAKRYKELHLRGHRATISPPNTDGQDAVDRLMLTYQSWGGRPAPAAASVPSQSEPMPTAQLTNRFADHNEPQALSPVPLSANSDISAPRSLLGRGTGHDLLLYQAEKRIMELEEAEAALVVERKNTEALEKRLNALIRKNRRLVLGSGN